MTDCYFAQLGYDGCQHRADGQLDRAHLIPAQRLRIAGVHGEDLWDLRAWIPLCRRHHHLLDNKFIHLRREELPEGIEDYATEHGVWWSLERDYPGPDPVVAA